jgi:beta-lactamase regulating signal transducer with metallopeptidase domain
MNDSTLHLLAAPLLISLLRTGIVLTFSGLALSVFLRLFRVASPTVRRVAYVAVLAQGWLFIQGPFAVPVPKFLEALSAKESREQLARDPRTEREFVTERSLDLMRPSGSVMNECPATSEHFGCHWREADVGAGPWSRRSASVFDSPTDPEISRPERARTDDCSILAGTFSPRSTIKLQSTGGPKLPPVAPDLRTLVLTEHPTSTNGGSIESSTPFRWLLALVGVWAAGIVVLVGRAAWNYARVVRQMPPLEDVDPEWAGEWAELQRQAGIRRPVPLAVAEHAGPVLFRLPRGYRLIVPAAAWRTLERSQRLSILRHELAHIERRDVWKSLAVRVLALPHWFNPLVWHCVRRFDECAEWACDEAARRDAPEHVPDYARALLQLVQRAEPVFFATRAARAQGLSHRIRRLLTPAQEKGSAMKTAVLSALVLGISLVNLTRLQTRADDESPKPVNVTVTAAPQVAGSTVTVTATAATAPRASTTPAPAAATTAVVNPAQAVAVPPGATPANAVLPSAALTITAVPVGAQATIATPRASTTPMATSVTSAITIVGVAPPVATTAQPAALAAPVAGATAQPAAAPAAASAPVAVPASQDPFAAPARASMWGVIGAAPQSTMSLPAPFGPRGAVAATAPSSGLPVADPTSAADPLAGPSASAPRQARADLGYILKNMNEFQVTKQVLEANILIWQKSREKQRQEMVRTAKERIAAEMDPFIKDLLEKGIAQKTLEIEKQTNPKLVAEAKRLTDQMKAKIVAEIARYAQEHHLLVVRRADFTGSAVPEPLSGASAGQQQAATKLYGREYETLNLYVNADTPPSNAWDQEVLYVAGRDHQHEADISDEIVKRLNAAYAASKSVGGKKTDIPQVFSFYVGLTR